MCWNVNHIVNTNVFLYNQRMIQQRKDGRFMKMKSKKLIVLLISLLTFLFIMPAVTLTARAAAKPELAKNLPVL